MSLFGMVYVGHTIYRYPDNRFPPFDELVITDPWMEPQTGISQTEVENRPNKNVAEMRTMIANK